MPSVAFASTDFSAGPDGTPVPNGCTYYRCTLPALALYSLGDWDTAVGTPGVNEQHGIGLIHGEGMLTGFDIVSLKLLMHQFVPPLMDMMMANGTTLVVDVDDFHCGAEHVTVEVG